MTLHEIKTALRNGPYAWPGGYPLFFITLDGAVLSHEAVRAEWKRVCHSVMTQAGDGWEVIGQDINWEDGELVCDHTGKRIESAYAD
jgi:hypothetical protein|tara:strand:+ start:1520 stop:1780 length:261 start_codon:yes stop_codon:yes gene_type:complete